MSKIQLKAPEPVSFVAEEAPKRKKPTANMRLVTLLVFLFFASLGVGIFILLQALFLDNAVPIVYLRAVADPPEAEQGKTLTMQMHVIRYRTDCTGVASRWVIDSTGARFAITDFSLEGQPALGEHNTGQTIKIPDFAAPGPAKYKLSINYYCNWTHRIFKPIIVGVPLVKFNILPRTTPLSADSTADPDDQ